MPLKGVYKVEIVGDEAGGGGGMRFEFGEGAPSGDLGQPGDVYLNTSNGDFYQNQNGSWEQIGNLRGPEGPPGQDGAQGPQGEQGPPGQDGADGFPTEAQWNDLVARVDALEGDG